MAPFCSKRQELGLAAVKRLVEAQCDTVSFESQERKGKNSILRLPSKPLVKERA